MLVQKRILLIVVMMGVALIIGASAIFVIYQGGRDRERLRLQDIVQSHARFLEEMARFDKTYADYPEGSEAAALLQFIESQRAFARRGLGTTGEIALAKREGDDIVFLFRQRGVEIDQPFSISVNSGLAGPMREALAGRSGTMIGRDYRGNIVLAAYEPVAVLNLGLVAKIDLDEVRERFTEAIIPLFLISVVTVLGASALFLWITEPMVRQLRDSEARFRGLFEHMKSGAAVFQAVPDGSDFVFTDLNRRGEEIGGIERHQAVGRRVTEVFPGTVQFGLLNDLKEVWASGAHKDLPARYYRDGRIEGWRDSHVYKLPNGEVVVLFDDVSQEKQAEQAVKESEARFRGTFENAAVGIAHVGMDGSWLQVNQRLCDIVGYGRDELVRSTFQNITYPGDLKADLEQLGLLLRGEIPFYSIEKRYIHKDRQVVWVNLTTALQRDEAGRPLYCISVVEDIGTRKRTEQSLCESEARMRALLDASEDEILLLSVEGRVLAINKAARCRLAPRIAGAEPLGSHLAQLLPHDLAEARLATVRDVAASATSAHLEIPIRARWFEFWFYPVRHPDQPVSEVAVYAREITERRAIEEQLRQSQKMQAIGQLTGGIAHDFNNLLTIIVGNLQLVEREARGNVKLRDFVSDALWAAARGGELTHRLLSFARMKPLRPAMVNLNDIVGGMTDLLRRTLGSNIEVVEELALDIPSVLVDTGELERALVNLAINARDAMPEGGTLTLRTGTAVFDSDDIDQHADLMPGSYVMLSVSDTGAGMPPKVIERVFEPFFTTKSGGQRSGLGLSMVYGFLKQSGGHVSVQSEEGSGTVFNLFFPQASAAGEAKPQAPLDKAG